MEKEKDGGGVGRLYELDTMLCAVYYIVTLGCENSVIRQGRSLEFG